MKKLDYTHTTDKFTSDLRNETRYDNTPDCVKFNGNYYTYKSQDCIAIPFAYIKVLGIDKMFYGPNNSTHWEGIDKQIIDYMFHNYSLSEIGAASDGKFIDKNGNIKKCDYFNDDPETLDINEVLEYPSDFFEFFELFNYANPEECVCGRYYIIDVKELNKKVVVIAFWDADSFMEMFDLTDEVVKQCDLEKYDVYIAHGVEPYMQNNKGNYDTDVKIDNTNNKKLQAIHLANARDKHEFFKDFRDTRDKLIGQKLTMSNGSEMPMAQYNALRYVDESVNNMPYGGVNFNNECTVNNFHRRLATLMCIPDLTKNETHYALQVNNIKPIRKATTGKGTATVYDKNQVKGLFNNIRGLNYAAEMIRKKREQDRYDSMIPKPEKQTPPEPEDYSKRTGNYNYYSSPEMRQASDELLQQDGVYYKHVDESRRKIRLTESQLRYINDKLLTEKKVIKNDKGEIVPEICPECGSKIGLYIQGEPVYLCSNKKCNKYFGTMPFKK